jgi:hypothetical protein
MDCRIPCWDAINRFEEEEGWRRQNVGPEGNDIGARGRRVRIS